MTASAVLIVACPCALGLATPAAMTAALGRGARFGLLFKSGEAIERCAAVDTVLLDKTGTLSEGRLAVERIVAGAGRRRRGVARARCRHRRSFGASGCRRDAARARAAGSLGRRRARRRRRAIPGRGVVGRRRGRSWTSSAHARCCASTESAWRAISKRGERNSAGAARRSHGWPAAAARWGSWRSSIRCGPMRAQRRPGCAPGTRGRAGLGRSRGRGRASGRARWNRIVFRRRVAGRRRSSTFACAAHEARAF